MIAIIDYDAGNIKSVEKALISLGQEVCVTRDADEILQADKVILPGVGAFGDAMEKLHRYGLVDVIRKVVEKKTPFLGICLGLQLLFERSDEASGVEGLGILKGEVLKIPAAEGLKIPHMGWNSLQLKHNGKLFQNLGEETYVYFVHSYYLKAEDRVHCKGYDGIWGIHRCVGRAGKCICMSVPSGKKFGCGTSDFEKFC